jgi:uncharacterized membrane protein YfcA
VLSGFGFALLGVPLLAILVGPKAAVVGTALLSSVLSLRVAARDRRAILWRTARAMLLASTLGMPVGVLVLSVLAVRPLQITIAVVVLAFVMLLASGLSIPEESASTDVGAGLLSGLLATSTGASGPPLVVALHGRAVAPPVFRSTLAIVFLAQGVIAAVAFAVAGQFTADAWLVLGAGLPGLAAAVLAGERLFARVDGRRFRGLVLAMLSASAIASLVAALVG